MTLSFREDRFVGTLRRLIALGPKLQNCRAVGLVPEEALAAEVVMGELRPYVDRGILKVEALAAPGFERRPSLVITLQGKTDKTIGLVGAHFDVVPADRQAEGWERDPFTLEIDSNGTLYGRGVTDCLGHVALLTDLLAQLGESGERPERTIKVVLIANEEDDPVPEVGLDYVVAKGALEDLKRGPVYWLDSADFGPTVGTGGSAAWELEVDGVVGHSGLPHNCVNALEVAMATSLALGEWFRHDFPSHSKEKAWGFISASSLKATVISVPNDKVSKIPGKAIVKGDIRLTPFYDMKKAMDGAVAFIADLDRRIQSGDVPAGFPSVHRRWSQRDDAPAFSRPLHGGDRVRSRIAWARRPHERHSEGERRRQTFLDDGRPTPRARPAAQRLRRANHRLRAERLLPRTKRARHARPLPPGLRDPRLLARYALTRRRA
jgi:acetylornithine deacetylase/succinyl-diaminopimelate desuccinylase-like protein